MYQGIQECRKEIKRYMDAWVSIDLPPTIVMRLNSQGPPVSYAEAASRHPKRKSITKDTAHMCNVQMRDAL